MLDDFARDGLVGFQTGESHVALGVAGDVRVFNVDVVGGELGGNTSQDAGSVLVHQNEIIAIYLEIQAVELVQA